MEEFSDQIGERLLRAREAAGLSVDDVLFKTRIPRSVIVALEAGDFSTFSSPTYAKSFLSQYSEFLGVDARLWLDALQPASFISGDFVQPLWKQADERKERKEEKLADGPPQIGWLSAVTVLTASGILVFLALKGYELLERKLGGEPVSPVLVPPSPSPVNAPPFPSVPPMPSGQPAPEPSAPKPDGDPPERPLRAIIVPE